MNQMQRLTFEFLEPNLAKTLDEKTISNPLSQPLSECLDLLSDVAIGSYLIRREKIYERERIVSLLENMEEKHSLIAAKTAHNSELKSIIMEKMEEIFITLIKRFNNNN